MLDLSVRRCRFLEQLVPLGLELSVLERTVLQLLVRSIGIGGIGSGSLEGVDVRA